MSTVVIERAFTILLAVVLTTVSSLTVVPSLSGATSPDDLGLEGDMETFDRITTGVKGRILGADWNPAGDLAILVGDGGIAMTYDGQSILMLASGTGNDLEAVKWSPDGSHALLVGDKGTVLRYKDGTIEHLDTGNITNRIFGLDWTTNGNVVMATGGGYVLHYMNGAFVKGNVSATRTQLFDIEWRPGAQYGIAVGEHTTFVTVTEDPAAAEVIEHDRPDLNINFYSVSWRPDGSSLLASGPDSYVLELKDSKVTVLSSGGFNTFLDVAWSPSGKAAFLCADIGVVAVLDSSGRYVEPFPETGVFTTLYDIAWKKDGSSALITGMGGTALVYPGKGGKEGDGGDNIGISISDMTIVALLIFLIIISSVVIMIIHAQRKRETEVRRRIEERKMGLRKGRQKGRRKGHRK